MTAQPRTARERMIYRLRACAELCAPDFPEAGVWLDDLDAIEAEAAAPLRAALDFDAMRVARGWPTPNHMRTAADALDLLSPARYGDVLRWFADRCDEWVWHLGDVAAAERLEQARAALVPEREAGE